MTPEEQMAAEKEAAMAELLEAIKEFNNKRYVTNGSLNWKTAIGGMVHRILAEKYHLIPRAFLVTVMYEGEYISDIPVEAYDESEAIDVALPMFNKMDWSKEAFSVVTEDMLVVKQLMKSEG